MIELSPEQQLLDNMYELQSARQRGGIDAEPAVFGGEIRPNSSFFIDYKTCTVEPAELDNSPDKVVMDGTHIVLSELPVDSADFKGAVLWVRDSKEGIQLPKGETSYSTVFFIGKTLAVKCIDYKMGTDHANQENVELYDFDTERLAEMLRVPEAILPLPISEEDPREIPEDLTKLLWPQNRAFTLSAGMFEREISQRSRLIADEVGYISEGQTDYDPTFYRLQVSESLNDIDKRPTQFDRILHAVVQFPEPTRVSIHKYGERGKFYLQTSAIKVKIFRTGMTIYGLNDEGREILYQPSTETQQFIDQVLQNAGIIEPNS